MAHQAGEAETVAAEAAEHKRIAIRLFRGFRAQAGDRKRRNKYRTASYKLGVALNNQLDSLQLGGFGRLLVAEADLESGERADVWPGASIVTDQGPDCNCLANFLRSMPALNLELDADTNHGAHHAVQHGQDRAGLRTHAYLMTFCWNVGLGEWKDYSRRQQVEESLAATLNATSCAADDEILQFALPFSLVAMRARGAPADDNDAFADEIRAQLIESTVWSVGDAKITNSRWFDAIKRFSKKECRVWGERVYGLASLVCDLDLNQRTLLKKQKHSAAAASADGVVTSGSKARDAALKIKRQAKHPIWHAYCMYSDMESWHKQWIMHDCCEPLVRWFDTQTLQLRGVDGSFDWLHRQCSGEYEQHLVETLVVIHDTRNQERWGVVTEFSRAMLDEDGLDAHVAQQDGLACYVGDMCVGRQSIIQQFG